MHYINSPDSRGRSRAAATSKMECFVIIVNDFHPLTIITKCSILDVAVVLNPSQVLFSFLWATLSRKLTVLSRLRSKIGLLIKKRIFKQLTIMKGNWELVKTLEQHPCLFYCLFVAVKSFHTGKEYMLFYKQHLF